MKRTKRNNKGFSLVELIIVIAIMAILAGVLAPQFVKYIGRSRISTDIQNAFSTLNTGFQLRKRSIFLRHSRLQLQSVQSSLIQREQQQLLSRQSLMVKQNGMAIQMLLVQQELRKRFLVEYQK